VVYFFIFLMSSYASRTAGDVSDRFRDVAQAINVTFLIGAAFLFIGGLASWQDLRVLSILVFLGLYLLHNIRKPLNVAFISDQIDNEVMASGLSVESQLVTLLMALIALILGAFADLLGVGAALALLGVGMLALAILTRVAAPSAPEAATAVES
jgi:hypothetical protein